MKSGPIAETRNPLLSALADHGKTRLYLLLRYIGAGNSFIDLWIEVVWSPMFDEDGVAYSDIRYPGYEILNSLIRCHTKATIAWCPTNFSRKLVESFVAMGINQDSCGFTLLHIAVGDLKADNCEYLISSGLDINAADDFGMSPLLEAVFYGNILAAQLLLSKGADVTHRAGVTDSNAAHRVEEQKKSSRRSRRDFAVDKFCQNHWSALHIAIHRGFPTIAKILIRAGIDVAIKDCHGSTALDIAKKNLSHDVVHELAHCASTLQDKSGHMSSEDSGFFEKDCGQEASDVTSTWPHSLNVASREAGNSQSAALIQGVDSVAQAEVFGLCSRCILSLPGDLKFIADPGICWLCRLLEDEDKNDVQRTQCTQPCAKSVYVIDAQASEVFLQIICEDGGHVQRYPVKVVSGEWHDLLSTWNTNEDDSTHSPAAFAITRHWLKNCLFGHSQCSQHIMAQYSPTRIIDVGDSQTPFVHLVQHEKLSSPYVALSHRWGVEDLPRTTIINLKKRLQHMDTSELTRVMQDAIEITRNLGYRYLWIDALCIIQNSQQDWLLEASRMSNVFNGAVVTIAAADAEEHSQGILRPRQAHCVRPFIIPYPEGIPCRDRMHIDGEEKFYVFPTSARVGAGNRRRRTLDSRGWILQEQLLSPRILYYDNGEIFWDCMTLSASESSPITSSLLFDERPDETWAFRVLRRVLASSTNIDTILARLPDIWMQIIQNYSSRQLSKQTDKLVALEGIIKPLSTILQDPPVAGMWRLGLWRQLSWWTNQSSLKFQEPVGEKFQAPSWSWLKVNTVVNYHNSCLPEAKQGTQQHPTWGAKDLEPLINVHSVEAQTLPGATRITGTLSISGPSFRYRITPNDMKKPVFKRWNAAKLNLNPGNWFLDFPQSLPLDVHCVVMAEDNVSKMLVCLCLVQDEEDLTKWRRAGLCHWDGLLWQVSKFVGKEPDLQKFEII